MNNNDIFKKLRVALMLRDDQIVDILQLVDFRISKGEIGNFFRNADHPKFVECGDQVLRNFLNGLVIHLRGTKDDQKNPMDIINKNKAEVAKADRFPKALNTKAAGTGTTLNKAKSQSSKPNSNSGSKTPNRTRGVAEQKEAKRVKPKTPKTPIVEKVKFNNGKNKKS